MSNDQTFIDAYGDKLEVENFNGTSNDGVIRMHQGTKNTIFGLKKEHRLPLAQHLLKPLDATILEGTLPLTEVKTAYGIKKVYADGAAGEISQSEVEYFRTLALKYAALAQHIESELAKEEAERQTRLAENAKLKERRNKLAVEFTGLGWITYGGLNGSSAKAIDRIIELEDAAK